MEGVTEDALALGGAQAAASPPAAGQEAASATQLSSAAADATGACGAPAAHECVNDDAPDASGAAVDARGARVAPLNASRRSEMPSGPAPAPPFTHAHPPFPPLPQQRPRRAS